MSSVLERVRQEGWQKGWQEGWHKGWHKGWQKGWQEGQRKGKAGILLELLAKRFGLLPSDLRHRLLAADIDTLDAWIDKVLDAPDLKSIFGS